MDNHFPSWITKHMVRNIRGFNLDAYLVALEGWRRGLKLTWYLNPGLYTDLKIIGFNPLGKSFSLQQEDKTHYFYRSRGDKVANEAVEIASNKQKTREYLKYAGINVPKGKSFHKNTSIEQMVQYGLNLGFPLVVKPTYGSLGKGVTTNINSKEQLKESILKVFDMEYDDVIVEQFFDGEDYRLYVVGDQVVAATKRVPAHVVGDGRHSIEELIKLKNEVRSQNPYLRTKLITIDNKVENVLRENGYRIQDVPKDGEFIKLNYAANISAGGDPLEALNDLSDELKTMAINAIKAIPGLVHGGVDVLVRNGKYMILEINPTADISMHMFPIEGQPINVPEYIIDHYFPHTKGLSKDRNKIYFNYREIRKLLRRGQVQDYVVTDAPKGPIYARRYVISGRVQKVGYRKWIQRQARKYGLHGYTRNLRNGKVVVVVANENKRIVDAFKNICFEGSRQAEVEKVKEYEWDSIICNGFYIRKTR